MKRSKFKYLWKATFENRVITQHPMDLYSKHDPNAEWNPSSFRDFQEYFEKHPDELRKFELVTEGEVYTLLLDHPDKPEIVKTTTGKYGYKKYILLHKEKRPLRDVRVIYYRNMESTILNGVLGEPRVVGYALGYQGVDENGNNRQKVISVL